MEWPAVELTIYSVNSQSQLQCRNDTAHWPFQYQCASP